MNRPLTAVLVVVIAFLGWTADRYRTNAITYQHQRDTARSDLRVANATLEDMAAHQLALAELDAKYTKELADEKAANDALRRDVDAGIKRLRLAATCPKASSAASSPGVADDAAPELTRDARQNYFTLREQLSLSQKQILGLQDYIRTQCAAK